MAKMVKMLLWAFAFIFIQKDKDCFCTFFSIFQCDMTLTVL